MLDRGSFIGGSLIGAIGAFIATQAAAEGQTWAALLLAGMFALAILGAAFTSRYLD